MKWTAEKLHDHCRECSELAASAVEHAHKTDATSATSAYTNGTGEDAVVLHQAKVTLK